MCSELQSAKQAADLFTNVSVLVLGDIMLDQYIYGTIERISPESPVPVVHYQREKCMPGGAGNAAVNIRALSASVVLCGLLGNDESGAAVKQCLADMGITADAVSSDTRSTTVKTRIIAQQNHQIVRVDREVQAPADDRERKAVKDILSARIPEADAVLIADYNKGTVTPDVCRFAVSLSKKQGIPVIVDPKGIDYSKYEGVTVLKPNISELEDAAGHMIRNSREMQAALEDIVARLDLEAVILTRGSEGMSILAGRHSGADDNRGNVVDIPASAREVYDLSGAGDTAAAAISLCLASDMSIFEAARIANTASGIAVSKAGTSTVHIGELVRALEESETAEEEKIVSFEELKERVDSVRRNGGTIVFTNGCFDLLHYGHVRYLQNAAQQGDFLAVAINADKTIRALKGRGRPVIPQDERAHILASLECVDAVIVFYEEKPLRMLRELQPHVLVKGSDYTRDGVVGHEIVDGYGGEIYLAPLEDGWSTTGLIEKIQNS